MTMSIVEESNQTASTSNLRFAIALSLLLIGYLCALVGCIAFFKIPLLATCLMMLAGTFGSHYIPRLVDSRFAFGPVTRVYIIANVAGSIAIVALLALFANSEWRRWYVHPAGFQSTWFVMVLTMFHIATIRSRISSQKPSQESVTVDHSAEQKQNPYAPPMKTR